MSLLNQIRMYGRFALGLREFLKEPIDLEQSHQVIKQRLANREKNFLNIVTRAIYGNKHSPYLKLLEIAHCEYGDIKQMVQSDGIEETLRMLFRAGVYINLEEFKGNKEVVRGGKIFRFRESDFDNPFLLRQLEGTTGGSRSAGSRTFYDFDHITLGQAVYQLCLLDAHDALTYPVVLWRPIMPGNGPRKVLEYVKIGRIPEKWFSPIRTKELRPSLKNRMATKYIVNMGRFWGVNLPAPEYVAVDNAIQVAQSIADLVYRHEGCWVHTGVSNAVRICQAAKEKNLEIKGAKFLIGGEPITEIKRKEIESVGVDVCPRYAFSEAGGVGFGCLCHTAPDDVHFFKDSLALIQHRREVPHAGVSVDAFLFTTLLASAPKILLNVENGDYGVVENRRCGCYFDKLGFSEHIYNIRSFDKLTSQGMTFFGSDLIRLIEEVLPAKFGGTSIDYQMLEEEEDDTGHTHLSVIVSPEVGAINEDEIIQMVLTELSRGKDTYRMMTQIWYQAKTIRVKRIPPLITASGKLLPLHIQRGN